MTAPAATRALDALQRWLQHVITDPSGVVSGISSSGHTGGSVTRVDLASEIVRDGARLDATGLLNIYHHAYRARLIDCLASDYPALRKALDVAGFDALAATYIVRFRSRSPVLQWFGSHMPELCAGMAHEHALALADLARLEWAIVEVIHTADAPALTQSELLALSPASWATARMRVNPALRVLHLNHPVNAYYRAFREAQDAGLPGASPALTLVHRRLDTVFRSDLTSPQAALLVNLQRGAALGPALAQAVEQGASEEDVGAWFEDWTRSGVFCSLELGSPLPG